jgi:hypothetical protein
MAKRHGPREQKRAAKQKAKRNEKRRQLARATSKNPAVRLLSAASWPIVATLEPESLWDVGIGNLVIARRAPGGRLLVGVYLVDAFCLGVKNALWKEVSETEFQAMLGKMTASGGRQRPIAPERFAKLVYCAADYAQSQGISPHPDFHTVRHLMDGIDPSLCADEFQFGHNGKPLYIEGPNDSAAVARMLAARVNARGGQPLAGPRPLELDYEEP